MTIPPDLYYPCLAETERGACRLAYRTVVFPFLFVFNAPAIDAWFASQTGDFPVRKDTWLEMFGFVEDTVTYEGMTFRVYIDQHNFLMQWSLYEPIYGEVEPRVCRQATYSD
jgi:hypothetical protein